MGLSIVSGVSASSHREAPLIAEDPVADNTDVYAFVSPDDPDSVTLIANWIPAEDPAAGPNFYHFGEDVLYNIHIDNDGDAVADVTYEWRFRNDIQNPNTYLYATGSINSVEDVAFNYRQRYDLFEVRDGVRTALVENQIMLPDNVGPVTVPDYEALVEETIVPITTPAGEGLTFSGQRDDAFYADIGSIFDLGQLRPFLPAYQPAPRDAQPGVDFFAGYNVHTTSIQVPTDALTEGDDPVIGVWSTSERPKVRVFSQNNSATPVDRGRFVQVSRLGNPLVNEVVIPLGIKDTFNNLAPAGDAAALSDPDPQPGDTGEPVLIPLVQDPELAGLLGDSDGSPEQGGDGVSLYDIDVPPTPRDDLVDLFLTGFEGINQPAAFGRGDGPFGEGQPAELLRLNTSIEPTGTDPNEQSRLGLLAGENDGFPNGRRLGDDVIDIALRAVAGGTPFTPRFNDPDSNDNGMVDDDEDQPNNDLSDGVPADDQRTHGNDQPFLLQFPYQATPWQGFSENNELRGRATSGDTVVTEPGPRQ
jgi:hypothetical protein